MRQSTSQFATTLRAHALRMVHRADASHIGTCLSAADIVAVLYNGTLRIDPERPDWEARDRFFLSKGHGAAIVYAALAECGFFALADLDGFSVFPSLLTGHISHQVPGVELSTGSLGHALPVACGVALAAKRAGHSHRGFVLLSDGELDEGSNWEAILFAAHHGLDNLVVIVDYNRIQSLGRVEEVLELEPLTDKFRAFRWAVHEVDGHNVDALQEMLQALPFDGGRPSILIAHTTKGKGVSYMEDELQWHYRSPKQDQLRQALEELGLAQ